MARSKARESNPSGSVGKLVELFETHDMGDRWDEMPEAHFDIDFKKRTHWVQPVARASLATQRT